jgi:hypothetical protein
LKNLLNEYFRSFVQTTEWPQNLRFLFTVIFLVMDKLRIPRILLVGGGLSSALTYHFLSRSLQSIGLPATFHLWERCETLGGRLKAVEFADEHEFGMCQWFDGIPVR